MNSYLRTKTTRTHPYIHNTSLRTQESTNLPSHFVSGPPYPPTSSARLVLFLNKVRHGHQNGLILCSTSYLDRPLQEEARRWRLRSKIVRVCYLWPSNVALDLAQIRNKTSFCGLDAESINKSIKLNLQPFLVYSIQIIFILSSLSSPQIEPCS